MPVIAMTREMGSLGKDVAAGLTDQLGLAVSIGTEQLTRIGVEELTTL